MKPAATGWAQAEHGVLLDALHPLLLTPARLPSPAPSGLREGHNGTIDEPASPSGWQSFATGLSEGSLPLPHPPPTPVLATSDAPLAFWSPHVAHLLIKVIENL